MNISKSEQKNKKDRNLEHKRSGSWREVEVLSGVWFWVIFGQEALNDDRLSRTLLSNQEHGLEDMKKKLF